MTSPETSLLSTGLLFGDARMLDNSRGKGGRLFHGQRKAAENSQPASSRALRTSPCSFCRHALRESSP